MAMKFAVIGCGNVGTHYTKMWLQAGHELAQVHFRSQPVGQIEWLHQTVYNVPLNKIHQHVDALLLAIPDDQIAKVASTITTDALIIQPSGTFDLHQLPQPNKATLWAIYSIVKNATIDFQKVPFAVETTSKKAEDVLTALMVNVGATMHPTTQSQREIAHLTAVMANNFTNALYQKALTLLQQHQLSGELLLPIIQQTAMRLSSSPDATLQTGPAKRGDHQTIEKHLDLLKHEAPWKQLYESLSNIILQQNEHRKL